MKKYILLLLIAVCTQLSAFALDKETIIKGTAKLDGVDIPIWFNIISDGIAEIGNGKNAAISQYAEGKLIIPASIKSSTEQRNYKVTKVANFAFSLCSKLTEVVLEEGITEIGEQAFSGCNNLQKIGYPTSLTTIGRGAFMGCKYLKHADLPQNLLSIGQEAFAENLFVDNKILLPKKVTTIPVATFADCKLQVVVLPPALTSIEEDAFAKAEDCDFYIFDGHVVPSLHEKSVSAAGHWFATKAQTYGKESFCNGLLLISKMIPQNEFTTEGITYKVLQEPEYPGVFTASAYKKGGETSWNHNFRELKETITNASFPGKWKPEFCINGIEQDFFTGKGIEKLHHIALPASIKAIQAKSAFANCKALVSLDLLQMKPLAKAESDELLNGIPENTIVYAPKEQTQEHRACNTILTQKDGKRHTSHFKIYLDNSFDELAKTGNMTYNLPYVFTADKATFYRSSFKNKKNETLILPFTAKPNGKVYAFEQPEEETCMGETMVFVKKDEMLANKPYIYMPDGSEIEAEDVEITTQIGEKMPLKEANLYGVYTSDLIKKIAEKKLLSGTFYTYLFEENSKNGVFIKAEDDAEMTPFHAFFHLHKTNASEKLTLIVDGEETTGIQTLSTDTNDNNKSWFNLQGIKLNSKPKKGIYIHNGKKLMIQ